MNGLDPGLFPASSPGRLGFFFSLSPATWGLHFAQGGGEERQDLPLGPSGLRFFSGGDKGPGRALYFPVVTVTSLLQTSSAVQMFPFFNLVGTLDCANGQVPLSSLVAKMLRAKYFVCTQWM